MTDPKLVKTISELYSMYSGYEIEDATKIVLAQMEKQEALERAVWELERAHQHVEELKNA